MSLALVFQSQWSFSIPAIRLCCQFYSSAPKPSVTAVAALGRPRIHFNPLSDPPIKNSPNSPSKPSVRRQILETSSKCQPTSPRLCSLQEVARTSLDISDLVRSATCDSVPQLDRFPRALRLPQFALTPRKGLPRRL